MNAINVRKIFCLFIFLSLTNAFAVDISQYCPREHAANPKIDDYALRIEDPLNRYGCDAVTLYAFLVNYKAIDVMDLIDEDPKVAEILLDFMQDKKIFNLLLQSDQFNTLLQSGQISAKTLRYFRAVWLARGNATWRSDIRRKLPLINFFVLSAYYAKSSDEAIRNFDLLRHTVEPTAIEAFSLMVAVFCTSPYHYEFKTLVSDYALISKTLSRSQFDSLVRYIDILPLMLQRPEDWSPSQVEEHQKRLLFLYAELYQKYHVRNNGEMLYFGLVNNFAPLLILQHRGIDSYLFREVFSDLINGDFLTPLLFDQNGNLSSCGENSKFGQFNDENRGIVKLLHFYREEKALYTRFMTSRSGHADSRIDYLMYTARAFQAYNAKQWKIFKALAVDLSDNFYTNIATLHRLEQVDYFKIIDKTNDYDHYVVVESDDTNGRNARKYEHILFTSVEGQNSYSVMQELYSDDIDKVRSDIEKLSMKSVSQLEEHTFTSYEKAMKYVDMADNVIAVASLIAAPLTGGASLSYLALKTGVKKAGTAGMKAAMNAAAKKMANKVIAKVRIGRRTMYDQMGEKSAKTFGRNLNQAAEQTGSFAIGMTIGGLLFFSGYQPVIFCGEE